jgi:uncharacterized protein (TIGR02246 family)
MPAQSPEDMARAFTEAFNSGDLDVVMELYEAEAVLVPEPGQVASGTAAIRSALAGFLGLKGTIEIEPHRILSLGDVALANTTWKLAGTNPDGTLANLSGDTTEVIRRQADGTWRYVIDDPFSQPRA